jgi:hypothetical protein
MLKRQSIRELKQIGGHRVEGADLLVGLLARSRHDNASHDDPIVNASPQQYS